MQHEKIKSMVGMWVAGADFYNREREVENLIRRLRGGQHLSLAAQRRTGKTSLLREVARQLDPEIPCVYVDLEDARDEADAIASIALQSHQHQSLRTRVASLIGSLSSNVGALQLDKLKIDLHANLMGDWRAKGDRIMADLGAEPMVLMLDELPMLLVRLLRSRPEAAGMFLSWLRRACLADNHLVVVITGSIGLAPIAARAGLSGTLNHYSSFDLRPWDPSTTLSCLVALGRTYGITWEPQAREEVVAVLGSCIPFHVQLMFQLLEEDARRTKRAEIKVEDVRRIYPKLLGSHGSAELAHMEERLRQAVDPPLHALTLDLLTEAAVAGSLRPAGALQLAEMHGVVAAKQALRDVLDVLEHDGYLRHDAGEWRFASKLLRDWWSSRNGSFYTPLGSA